MKILIRLSVQYKIPSPRYACKLQEPSINQYYRTTETLKMPVNVVETHVQLVLSLTDEPPINDLYSER